MNAFQQMYSFLKVAPTQNYCIIGSLFSVAVYDYCTLVNVFFHYILEYFLGESFEGGRSRDRQGRLRVRPVRHVLRQQRRYWCQPENHPRK